MSHANLSRRSMMTAAASVPVIVALPAAAATPAFKQAADPILATIEAHRRAWSELDGCSELDQAASHGDKEAERELDRLNAALDDATEKLLDPPQQLPALRRYLHMLPIT